MLKKILLACLILMPTLGWSQQDCPNGICPLPMVNRSVARSAQTVRNVVAPLRAQAWNGGSAGSRVVRTRTVGILGATFRGAGRLLRVRSWGCGGGAASVRAYGIQSYGSAGSYSVSSVLAQPSVLESVSVAAQSSITRMPGSTWTWPGMTFTSLVVHARDVHGMPIDRITGLSFAELKAIHDNLHNGWPWDGRGVAMESTEAKPTYYVISSSNVWATGTRSTLADRQTLRRQGRYTSLTNFAMSGTNGRAFNLINGLFPKSWFNLR